MTRRRRPRKPFKSRICGRCRGHVAVGKGAYAIIGGREALVHAGPCPKKGKP